MILDAKLYLNAFQDYGIKINGGTIHDFIKESFITYHSGTCPVYYINYIHNNIKAVIGGNYATNKKPELKLMEKLDF